jgi:NADH:ubiquinone reductase (H+-translocating)
MRIPTASPRRPVRSGDAPRTIESGSGRHRVVIVGGGFGGLYAARNLLPDPRFEVILVDRRNFHLFQPLLYQLATGALGPSEITQPLRSILGKRAAVLLGDAVTVDPARREVGLSDGATIPYDTLVVATGSGTSYFGHDVWARDAPGLKSIEEATEIRRRVLLAFEAAEWEPDPVRRAEQTTFVIVGGGPTGVELAGALGELATHTLDREFRSINSTNARIYLIEALDRILPTYPPDRSAAARRQLERRGIVVRTGTRVVDVDGTSVRLTTGAHEERMRTCTVLWAAGAQVSAFTRTVATVTGAETGQAGRIVVGRDLTIPGHPEIFAVGGAAVLPWQPGRPVPDVAQGGIQAGTYAARAIRRRRSGRAVAPFRYSNHGDVAVIGTGAAVTDVPWLGPLGRQSGVLGWLLWAGIHIYYLGGVVNRLVVLARWTSSVVTRSRASRLITGQSTLPIRTNPGVTGRRHEPGRRGIQAPKDGLTAREHTSRTNAVARR